MKEEEINIIIRADQIIGVCKKRIQWKMKMAEEGFCTCVRTEISWEFAFDFEDLSLHL